MTGPGADVQAAPRRSRRPLVVVGIGVGVIAVVALAVGVMAVRELTRTVPEFASLAQSPDRSLHGTVAYVDGTSDCVRIVAAAGQPSKDVLCLPAQDMAKAQTLGKEIGPQLVWRAEGRLEVTMFRMTGPPPYLPGWQKVVDVRTGAVQDTPAADVPSQPDLGTRAMVSPAGERITSTSDGSSGHITVTVTGQGPPRTLLDAEGPGEYTYGLTSAFWAPNWQWVAADDGRILVVTTGNPSVTRVLTTKADTGFGGDDPRQAPFAVTATDILTTGQ